MNRLTATLYLRDSEVPTAEMLRDMLIKAFAANLQGAPLNEDVFVSLLGAYHYALADEFAERGKRPPALVTGEAAEKLFTQNAFAGFRTAIPDVDERSESIPSWPYNLPYNAEYVPQFIAVLGYIAGVNDGTETRQWFDYCRREDVNQSETKEPRP